MAMLSDFASLKARLGQYLGMQQTSDLTLLGDLINDAGEMLWSAYAWAERKKYGTLQTVAAVEGDDLTGSLGGSSFTTTSGTDWSTYAGRKVIVGGAGNAKWYWIKSSGSGVNTMAVDRAIDEAVSSEDFVVVQDEYQLPAVVDTVLANEFILIGSDGRKVLSILPADAAELWPYPLSLGLPTRFHVTTETTSTDQAAGTVGETDDRLRIRLGPNAPLEVYSFRYAYLSRWTEQSGSSTPPIARERLPLLLEWAKWLAYANIDEFRDTDLAEKAEARVGRMLDRAIRSQRALHPNVTYVRPFDSRGPRVGIRYNLPPEA